MLSTRVKQYLAVFAAMLVAAGCQLIQVYLASRTPAAWDVLLNGGGLIAGLVLSKFVEQPRTKSESKVSLASFIAISAFLGYHLAPFTPSLDFDLLKAAASRLLTTPGNEFGSFLMGSAYVLLIAGALKAEIAFKSANRILVVAVLSILLLKPITAGGQIELASLLGMAAVLVPACLMPATRRIFFALAILAIFLYIHDGLTPFELRAVANYADLSPLATLVGGSWIANITAIFWKSFVLISAISLLFGAIGGETRTPALIVIFATVLVESGQVFVASGTPSTADIFLAFALSAVFGRSVRSGSHHLDGYGRNHHLKSRMSNRRIAAELSKTHPLPPRNSNETD